MNTFSLSSKQELRLTELMDDLRFDVIPGETFDKNAVETAIERIYIKAGLDLPYIIWCDGPFQLAAMPLMLQLIAFQPDADRRRTIRRRYGACSSRVAADELQDCLNLPVGLIVFPDCAKQSGDESIVLVRVKNSTAEPDGTFRDYFLRVPPSIRTVQEAVAWTFGMQPKQYGPEVET